MKRVILTVGPQYAGKSTFCKRVAAARPDVVLVSRDAILTELFGTVWLDKYTGGHVIGIERMWEVVAEHLQRDGAMTMVLDTWNGGVGGRRAIVERLRPLGATRVEGWYFITSEDACVEWLLKQAPWREVDGKEPSERILRYHIDDYRECYRAFHAQSIEGEGIFDAIQKIDPREPFPADPMAC